VEVIGSIIFIWLSDYSWFSHVVHQFGRIDVGVIASRW